MNSSVNARMCLYQRTYVKMPIHVCVFVNVPMFSGKFVLFVMFLVETFANSNNWRIFAVAYGSSSVGRALVSKTRCREFEPLLPCIFPSSMVKKRKQDDKFIK